MVTSKTTGFRWAFQSWMIFGDSLQLPEFRLLTTLCCLKYFPLDFLNKGKGESMGPIDPVNFHTIAVLAECCCPCCHGRLGRYR